MVGTYLNKTIDHDMRWWRNTSYNWKSREKKTKKIYDWKKYLSIYDINTVRSRINENVDEKKNEWTNERQKKNVRKKERKHKRLVCLLKKLLMYHVSSVQFSFCTYLWFRFVVVTERNKKTDDEWIKYNHMDKVYSTLSK